MTRPCLVVIESTVAPRTLRDLIAPLVGEGFFLIHCPERVRPGRLLYNLRGMARLVGASNPEIAALGAELRAEIAAVRSEMRQMEQRLIARIESVRGEIASDLLGRMFQMILGAVLVNIVAMAGLLFAFAKLLGH